MSPTSSSSRRLLRKRLQLWFLTNGYPLRHLATWAFYAVLVSTAYIIACMFWETNTSDAPKHATIMLGAKRSTLMLLSPGSDHQPVRISSTTQSPDEVEGGKSIPASESSSTSTSGEDQGAAREATHHEHTQPRAVMSATGAPKACLAMIMKNEGPILPRLFDSIKGFVSEYCVVDTGSTDDTMDVLRSIDMPGLLVEEPFVDFATTRNFLLDTCRERTTCDYLVLLDADMVLRVSPKWDWAKMDGADVYDFVQVSSIEYANVRMVKRTADKIKVVGSTHEYYDVPSEYTHKLLPKHLVHIEDVGDGKAKGDKFERDERLLRAELAREPDNVRTVFYLANTLKDQGKYREAIPYYERRATMGGWYAEADYSWFMLSSCYLALHDVAKAREYAEKAAFGGWYRRAEPLYYLAFYLDRQGEHALAWYYATLAAAIPKPEVSTVLFISYSIYDYWVEYERANLCRHVFPTEYDYCLRLALAFLNNALAPESLRQYFLPDLAWYVRPLKPIESIIDVPGDQIVALNLGPDRESLELITYQGGDGGAIHRWTLAVEANGDGRPGVTLTASGQVSVAAGQMQGVRVTALGPGRMIGGPSYDGHRFVRGHWPAGPSDGASPLDLATYAVVEGDASKWALFSPTGTGSSMYCILSWHPTLEVGVLAFDDSAASVRCDLFRSVGFTPRAFSFLEAESHGVTHRGDTLFLVKWQGSQNNTYSIVSLGPSFHLRSYTLPFTLNGVGEDAPTASDKPIALDVMDVAGREHVVVAYMHGSPLESSKQRVAIKAIPIDAVLKRMVAP